MKRISPERVMPDGYLVLKRAIKKQKATTIKSIFAELGITPVEVMVWFLHAKMFFRQSEIARELGLSRSTISRIFNRATRRLSI